LRVGGEAHRGLDQWVGGEDPALRRRAGAVPPGDLTPHPLRGRTTRDHARRSPPYHRGADGGCSLLRSTDAPQALLRVHVARRRQRPVAPRRGSGGPSRPPALPSEPAPVQLDGYGLFGHLENGGQEIPRVRQRARPLGDASSQPGPGHRCRLRPARREGPARTSRRSHAL
ncbi:23S rRNA (adenine(2503)-C(2))-methyltransferase @ tRNA (adenine(37)-C(2))-methyltransferase, partial [uncultured Rubrobacteraceae bacterium]